MYALPECQRFLFQRRRVNALAQCVLEGGDSLCDPKLLRELWVCNDLLRALEEALDAKGTRATQDVL